MGLVKRKAPHSHTDTSGVRRLAKALVPSR
jgi:hypothetical protein